VKKKSSKSIYINIFEKADKRVRMFEATVEIPDTSKLLIANCKMIELYTIIQ